MEISCSHCGAQYRFEASQVPPGGYQAQCTACQGVFEVPDPSESTQLRISCPTCQTLYQFALASVPEQGYQAACTNCQSEFFVPGRQHRELPYGGELAQEPKIPEMDSQSAKASAEAPAQVPLMDAPLEDRLGRSVLDESLPASLQQGPLAPHAAPESTHRTQGAGAQGDELEEGTALVQVKRPPEGSSKPIEITQRLTGNLQAAPSSSPGGGGEADGEISTTIISLAPPQPQRRLTTPGGAWEPVALDSGTFAPEKTQKQNRDPSEPGEGEGGQATRSQKISLADSSFYSVSELLNHRSGLSQLRRQPRTIGLLLVICLAICLGVLFRRLQERALVRGSRMEQIPCADPTPEQHHQLEKWLDRIAFDDEQGLASVARELNGLLEQPETNSTLYGVLVVLEVLRGWDSLSQPADIYDGGLAQSDQAGAMMARAGRAWHKINHCNKEGWVAQAAWFWSMASGIPIDGWVESGSYRPAAPAYGSGQIVAWQDVARAEVAYQWFRQHRHPGLIWAGKIAVEGAVEQLGKTNPLRRTLLRLAQIYVEQGTQYGKGIQWLKELANKSPPYSKAIKALEFAPPAPVSMPPLQGPGLIERIHHALPPSQRFYPKELEPAPVQQPSKRSSPGKKGKRSLKRGHLPWLVEDGL